MKISFPLKIFILIMSGLFLGGCVSQKKKSKSVDSQESALFLPIKKISDSSCAKAMQEDPLSFQIPLPLGAIPEKKWINYEGTDKRGEASAYRVPQKSSDILDFLLRAMEGYGWQTNEVVRHYHLCAVFSKPYQRCVIIIAPISVQLSLVTIFISQEEVKKKSRD